MAFLGAPRLVVGDKPKAQAVLRGRPSRSPSKLLIHVLVEALFLSRGAFPDVRD
jgi:hypothetical protein